MVRGARLVAIPYEGSNGTYLFASRAYDIVEQPIE